MPVRCFLSAPLSTLAEQNLNATLASIVRSCGYECYVPQEQLPPDGRVTPAAVLQHNVEAVTASDLILSVLDKPGSGVVFEVAYAFALRKPIVLFRSDKQDYLGKVLEGLWAITPAAYKATSLEELRQILLQLQTEDRIALAAAD